MLKNLDALKMKMAHLDGCTGVGVEVDGRFYFYEDFDDDEGAGRAFQHFPGKKITFYPMAWARRERVKELMERYIDFVIDEEGQKAIDRAFVIAGMISAWTGCDLENALEQVEGFKIDYQKIA